MPSEMSTKEIYDLVSKMENVLSGKIDRVDTSVRILTQSFNDLEAGRLSALEKDFAVLKAHSDIRDETSKPYTNLFWEVVKYAVIAFIAAVIAVLSVKPPS